MEPIIVFALFAEDIVEYNPGYDILKVISRVTVIPLAPDELGVTRQRMLLLVQIIADTGTHILSFIHDREAYLPQFKFEILPQHAYVYTAVVERDFPIKYTDELSVNVFPLYVDGIFLAEARILSNPM